MFLKKFNYKIITGLSLGIGLGNIFFINKIKDPNEKVLIKNDFNNKNNKNNKNNDIDISLYFN